MHSLTSRFPIPNPRAFGSTSSSRNLATVCDCLTRKTEPTFSPSLSAIQQRSRSVSRMIPIPFLSHYDAAPFLHPCLIHLHQAILLQVLAHDPAHVLINACEPL